ncbi:MAG TPA: uracil-DNA glycosylase [Candidatus Acidoferrum sp.]|jgi:uracil-DNA glycosylase family 4
MPDAAKSLHILNQEIISCRKCPRLVTYREKVAAEKRRAFRDQTYWGKPIPGFGDPQAQLLILGLAPAAHGGNRTGRVFTGDRSADFLFAALHQAGFANQPTSTHRGDGLRLHNAYISAAARCAPPDNKPLPTELTNCRPYLEREIAILQPKAVLALGKIAWDVFLTTLQLRKIIASRAPHQFAHAAEAQFPAANLTLFGAYHPSQQNTQTGRVTPAMYAQLLTRITQFLSP